ncbi:unnamed protein product (mitochondrion) [Plasmodiophora brassicae]|uniref:allantoinase n=1 Tax=Plasmodiophora brassicae TaxID=37360 RepID=A0A3P3YB16_PLABS|nr:unnamed protein product [Plasmodiophora brassicae]
MSADCIVYRSRRMVFSSDDSDLSPGEIVVDKGTGKVVAARRELCDAASSGIDIVDFGDLVVMPGLVDSHVHVNDPGRDHWERFDCATKAAVAGGTCTIADMPLNCIPVTTTADAVNVKIKAANGRLWADVVLLGGLVPENASAYALNSLLDAGVVSVKAFMCHSGIDDYKAADLHDLEAAMPILAARSVPLMVHAEMTCLDSSDSNGDGDTGDRTLYSTFLRSRPDQMELKAITEVLRKAEQHSCPVHIVHLSSAVPLPTIVEAKARHVPVTVETCPHYLCFSSEDIPSGATWFKCCPPIRDDANRDALWKALLDGHVDMIVSDHSPSSPDQKCIDSGDFMSAWGGISGVQFRLLAVWTEGRRRGVDFSHLCRWLCEAPARLVGLQDRKGKLAPGYDADFVVWDPEERSQVHEVHHLHKLTPYKGMEFAGAVHATYRHGVKVYSLNADRSGMFSPPTGNILFPLCVPIKQ